MAEDFTCGFCVRPTDPNYRGPTVDDEATPMARATVIEEYNQRRYAHYDIDFRRREGLRKHLEARAHYWFPDVADKDALHSVLEGIETTLDQWERRRNIRLEMQPALATVSEE